MYPFIFLHFRDTLSTPDRRRRSGLVLHREAMLHHDGIFKDIWNKQTLISFRIREPGLQNAYREVKGPSRIRAPGDSETVGLVFFQSAVFAS